MNVYIKEKVEEIEKEIQDFLKTYVCPATTIDVMQEIWLDSGLLKSVTKFVERNKLGDRVSRYFYEVECGLNDNANDLWDFRIVCKRRCESCIDLVIDADTSSAINTTTNEHYRAHLHIKL